jgi:hypothetical protein
MTDPIIKMKLRLPFYSWTLNPRHDYQLSDVPFKGKTFTFLNLNPNETEHFMDVQIIWQQEHSKISEVEINKIKLVESGIDFLNYLIYHARTLDLESEQMTFVSPRSVKDVSLIVGNNVPEQVELIEDTPQEFLDLLSYTNHFPETYDAFTDLLRDDELGVLDINLLVDSNHAIYERRYNEAVINCVTAVESRTFPLLIKWLANSFFNKNEKKAGNSLIEMAFADKLEILFGSIYSKALREKAKLLEDLKQINKLRNEIIHKGRQATKSEAKNCLKICSEFLTVVIFGYHDEDDETRCI